MSETLLILCGAVVGFMVGILCGEARSAGPLHDRAETHRAAVELLEGGRK